MIKMDSKRLLEIIAKFSSAKIFVVGDLMLDEFIWGKVSRISPEAPIPVVKVNSETAIPGGAGNVAVNLTSLGAKAKLSGVIGSDPEAKTLKKKLKERGVAVSGIVVDRTKPTTLKRRIIADNQQVVRMDREIARELQPEFTEKIIDYSRNVMPGINGIVISDYGKGVVTKKLIDMLRKFKKDGFPIAADPKTSHFDRYNRVTVITPNKHEVEEAQNTVIENEKTLIKAGRNLLKKLMCNAILITRGEEGMSLFERSGPITHIPTVAREVYDVTGAGDTVTSTFALSLACGATMKEAAIISNCAAGVVVGKLGTSTVTRDELTVMLEKVTTG